MRINYFNAQVQPTLRTLYVSNIPQKMYSIKDNFFINHWIWYVGTATDSFKMAKPQKYN